MSFLQTFRIQDPESSGFRILKSSKMFYLQIFRIQDPESSGSEDPAGKSQEGPMCMAPCYVPCAMCCVYSTVTCAALCHVSPAQKNKNGIGIENCHCTSPKIPRTP